MPAQPTEATLPVELAPRISASPLVGMTHFTVMVLFAALIVYFNVSLLLRRARVPGV